MIFCRVAALAVAALMAGCSSLPAGGPGAVEQVVTRADGRPAFALVDLDAGVVAALGQADPAPLPPVFFTSTPPVALQTLHPGARLKITVWESAGEGLYSAPDRRVTEFTVTVSEAGDVIMPYLGAIPASGRSPDTLRQEIEARLHGLALEPQVTVEPAGGLQPRVTLAGDVARPGRIDLSPGGLRLLDAISQAGGPRGSPPETELTLLRGEARAEMRLDQLLQDPRRNIPLHPGDTVLLRHTPRTFAALGAVTAQTLVGFDTDTLTLAAALAKSGGLRDSLADAGGVFLFRHETASRLSRLDGIPPVPSSRDGVPTVYRLDFSTPEALFLASAFEMRDGDILYVANAPAAEFRKFIDVILGPLLGSAESASTVGG
ncbi:MAG: polysaccharide export protein [Rhodobacteraceae bacterium]|nr:polysaccharide export protein [Paracoccaceae bacterium]